MSRIKKTLLSITCCCLFLLSIVPFAPTARATQVVGDFPDQLLTPQFEIAETETRVQTYYQSIHDWGMIVESRVVDVPSNKAMKFIGRTGHRENDLRPTAYAAMVLAFLAECNPPERVLSQSRQDEIRDKAIGIAKYLCASHVANDGVCVNGMPWGNQWQSALWSRSLGMACWLLWDHLDESTRQQAIAIIEYEANRFVDVKPKSSLVNDTGAEENAWNASITALACNMLPNHQQASRWAECSKRYMYNTFSVAADANDSNAGDDGRSIQDWVCTVNAHDDFTVENHGLVHVGYLKNALAMLVENSVHWSMLGQDPPLACQHHVRHVFDLLCGCMNGRGAAIYFAGNDWRLYETQCSDIVIYNRLRTLTHDRRAGYLEDLALKQLRERQQVEGGFFNGRRDLEYGGLCATRLISCFFSCQRPSVSSGRKGPMTTAEFDLRSNGVHKLEHGKTIFHRTSEKFASFSWAQKKMALTIPVNGDNLIWPHFDSYLGIVNAERSFAKKCRLTNLIADAFDNGFRCTGALTRLNGNLQQDFYFESPEGPFTIYIERLRPTADFDLEYRKTGIIGLDYAAGDNVRMLHGEFGELKTRGAGGKKQTVSLKSNWLNIDDRIGYVVRRSTAGENVMLYHDKNTVEPRKPHLQESIALISDDQAGTLPEDSWACVVTLLNSNRTETARANEQIKFQIDGNLATVVVNDLRFQVTLGESGQGPDGQAK